MHIKGGWPLYEAKRTFVSHLRDLNGDSVTKTVEGIFAPSFQGIFSTRTTIETGSHFMTEREDVGSLMLGKYGNNLTIETIQDGVSVYDLQQQTGDYQFDAMDRINRIDPTKGIRGHYGNIITFEEFFNTPTELKQMYGAPLGNLTDILDPETGLPREINGVRVNFLRDWNGNVNAIPAHPGGPSGMFLGEISDPSNGSVGQPGFWEGLLPGWGAGRAAVDDFQNGRWVWGTINAGFALLDATGVGYILKTGGRAIGNAFGRLLSRRSAARAGPIVSNGIEGAAFDSARELTGRQRGLLEALSGPNTQVTVRKSGVSMNDLRNLTLHTGDEFAILTRRGERLVLRGEGGVISNLSEMNAAIFRQQGYRFSGHTHTPGFQAVGSGGDKAFLRELGQRRNAVWGTQFGERPGVFYGNLADEINVRLGIQ